MPGEKGGETDEGEKKGDCCVLLLVIIGLDGEIQSCQDKKGGAAEEQPVGVGPHKGKGVKEAAEQQGKTGTYRQGENWCQGKIGGGIDLAGKFFHRRRIDHIANRPTDAEQVADKEEGGKAWEKARRRRRRKVTPFDR